jgi:hypothetical protein
MATKLIRYEAAQPEGRSSVIAQIARSQPADGNDHANPVPVASQAKSLKIHKCADVPGHVI